MVRELVYTARKFNADEALKIGLVRYIDVVVHLLFFFSFLSSEVCQDQASVVAAAIKLASLIASKSPVAVQGSKVNLNYSRDHTVDESLDYMVGI